ncbi:MAG TPA: oxidoreductase [Burkholderiales bacterium]|jgi:putative YhdH/YhfP family quinone oxidoreductase|nr:oxidoreductase [Burkholderiales bacterium]
MTILKAYRIFNEDGKVAGRFTDMKLEELDAGDVVIKVAYSSVNFKDALAATGAGKIIRRFPCVGGVDLSGTVVESADARLRKGDAVIATSFDIGVAHDGGYAEYARIPAGWIVPMPKGLDLFEAMALGTAGYTAALAVERMEHEGLKPANGPVIVTGATGGVGSIAVDILSACGYRVVALTGKEAESEYLKGIGAAEVMLRSSLDLSRLKPLDKATWAGAVDNLGGDVLSWIVSTMQVGGTLASIGLAASHAFNATVMPFILRGVSLLGVDSANTPMGLREKVWRRLGADLKPRRLQSIATTVNFADLPGVFEKVMKAQVRGRTVVKIG